MVPTSRLSSGCGLKVWRFRAEEAIDVLRAVRNQRVPAEDDEEGLFGQERV